MAEARDNFFKRYPPMFTGKDQGLGQFDPLQGFPTRFSQIGEGIDYGLDAGAMPFRFLGRGIGNIYNYLASPPKATQELEKIKKLYGNWGKPKGFTVNNTSIPLDVLYGGQEGKLSEVQEQLNSLQNNLNKKTDIKKGAEKGAGAETTDIDTISPILPEQVLREGKDEQTGVEDAPKKDDQSDAFTEAMKSLEDAASGETSKVKGLDYYKKQFADATGIDISGKPDTRAATIAFGLALMQNKAGKGFNVGRMLSSVGEAGEKALPLAESARKEARAAQVSAGTYALQERKAAVASNLAQQQKKIDSILAIEKEFRGYGNQRELERIKAVTKLKVEAIKQEAEVLKRSNDKAFDLKYKQFDLKGKSERTPVPTQKDMKVTLTWSPVDGGTIYPFASQEATQFATGYGQLQKADATLDSIEGNLQEYIDSGGKSVTLDKAIEFGNNILTAALGSDYSVFKDEEGKNITGPIQDNKILQQRLISQYKRFLTQETGNGISKIDVENIQKLLGNVNFFTNPAEAVKRIQEVREIFAVPKQQILEQLELFSDRKKHVNEDSYQETIDIINKTAVESSKLQGQITFDDFTVDKDGIKTYKLGF